VIEVDDNVYIVTGCAWVVLVLAPYIRSCSGNGGTINEVTRGTVAFTDQAARELLLLRVASCGANKSLKVWLFFVARDDFVRAGFLATN